MRKCILVFLLFYSGSFVALSSTQKKPFVFSLIVGSCFTGDTISLTLNGQPLIVNALAESDSNTGVTTINVYQDADGLWVQMQKQKSQANKLDLQREVTLDIQINGQQTTEVVD